MNAAPPSATDAKKPAKKSVVLDRLEALWDKGANFFNKRNTREKIMIIALAAAIVVFLDYWLFIHPVVQVFSNTLPQLSLLESDARSYQSDIQNRGKIKQSWADAKARLAESELQFVAPDELPALLENLSKLALGSNVKILSLKTGEPQEAGSSGRYTRVPVRMSAVAGTHELGNFLSRLESGRTFFKVEDLKIMAQQADPKRHQIELVLEVYRRSG